MWLNRKACLVFILFYYFIFGLALLDKKSSNFLKSTNLNINVFPEMTDIEKFVNNFLF